MFKVITVALAPLVLLATARAHDVSVECRAKAPTPSEVKALAGKVAEWAKEKAPGAESVTSSAAATVLDDTCVQLTAMTWDNEQAGGVALTRGGDSKGELLGVLTYPGARRPVVLPGGRFLVTYSGGIGSGQTATRAVALCSLAVDNWFPCADFLLGFKVTATGYKPDDAKGRDVGMSLETAVTPRGDTLVLDGRVTLRRYGTGPVVRRGVVSRIVLP